MLQGPFGDRLAVIISHSNYLVNFAGTEKYIVEQIQALRQTGCEALHLFPGANQDWAGNEPSLIGINWRDSFLGYLAPRSVVALLKRNRHALTRCYVQHTMFWQFQDLLPILLGCRANGVPLVFFFHDFFTCCPGAFVPCLNRTGQICPVPGGFAPRSVLSTCVERSYHDRLDDWRKKYRILLAHGDTYVAPSDFMRENLGAVYPAIEPRISVRGLVEARPRGWRETPSLVDPEGSPRPIRLAYLGYAGEHKGWQVWNRLIADPRLARFCEFYHLGSRDSYSPRVRCFTYSYSDGGPMAAVHLLEKLGIDLVLLWSLVPESYSYTLQESLAAGLPVLTSPASGNIAHTIRRSPTVIGRVFTSDNELTDFLQDREQVEALIRLPRRRYHLEPNPYLE